MEHKSQRNAGRATKAESIGCCHLNRFGTTVLRSLVFGLLFAFPVSFSLAIGRSFSMTGSSEIASLSTWFRFAVICLISTSVASLSFLLISFIRQRTLCANSININSQSIVLKRWILIFAAILAVAWLPYYMACFPGLFVYDAFTQTHYAICLGEINSFHPLIHTYWLSGCILLGNVIFNSQTIGFALYTTSQYIIFAILLGYTIWRISRLSSHIWPLVLSLLFFALFPVFPIMAISATKDTLFSGFLATLLAEAICLFRNPSVYFNSRSGVTILLGSMIFVALFRNNGIYIVFAAVLAALICLSPARNRLVRVLCPCLLIATLFSLIIPRIISTDGSTVNEMLGVPIQQIARTINLHGDSLSEDDVESIEYYLPNWTYYNESIVDPVKFYEGAEDIIPSNLADFLRLWFKLGLNYPETYFDAFVAMTYAYWYPFATYDSLNTTKPYLEFDAWELVSQELAYRDMGSDYEVFEIDNPSDWLFIKRHSLFPAFEPVVREICYRASWTNDAVCNALTSPGSFISFAYYIILASFYFCKRNQSIALLTILGVYYLTCLLGPAFLVRYILPLYSSLPILLCILDGLFFDKQAYSEGHLIRI